jgi:hypothetical protein
VIETIITIVTERIAGILMEPPLPLVNALGNATQWSIPFKVIAEKYGSLEIGDQLYLYRYLQEVWIKALEEQADAVAGGRSGDPLITRQAILAAKLIDFFFELETKAKRVQEALRPK